MVRWHLKNPDGGDMKNLSKGIAVFAILGLLVLVPVQAVLAENTTPSSHVRGDSDTRLLQHLGKLQEQGYDVSAIRAAVENGDMEEAKSLLREFMEEHRDELPVPHEGGMKGKHCRNPPV